MIDLLGRAITRKRPVADVECSQMIIRRATENDVITIANLHAESWRSAYRGILSDDYLDSRAHQERLAAWQERFSGNSPSSMFVLLADMTSYIAGFVCVFPEKDAVFGSLLDNLHVAPQVTGQGIGRQLLSEAARYLLTSGSHSGMYLWVIEQNRKARRFYEKAGGLSVDSAIRSTPDGLRVVALRYHWSDPTSLLL